MVINSRDDGGASRNRERRFEYRAESPAPFPGGTAAGPRFDDRTPGGMRDLPGGIGQFVSEEGGERKLSEEQAAERDRARRANKIYKQVCSDRGMTACFFNNFGTWSDFVNGKISDSEFYEQSESAAKKMAEEVSEQ